jgi:hypothetical protein
LNIFVQLQISKNGWILAELNLTHIFSSSIQELSEVHIPPWIIKKLAHNDKAEKEEEDEAEIKPKPNEMVNKYIEVCMKLSHFC